MCMACMNMHILFWWHYYFTVGCWFRRLWNSSIQRGQHYHWTNRNRSCYSSCCTWKQQVWLWTCKWNCWHLWEITKTLESKSKCWTFCTLYLKGSYFKPRDPFHFRGFLFLTNSIYCLVHQHSLLVIHKSLCNIFAGTVHIWNCLLKDDLWRLWWQKLIVSISTV